MASGPEIDDGAGVGGETQLTDDIDAVGSKGKQPGKKRTIGKSKGANLTKQTKANGATTTTATKKKTSGDKEVVESVEVSQGNALEDPNGEVKTHPVTASEEDSSTNSPLMVALEAPTPEITALSETPTDSPAIGTLSSPSANVPSWVVPYGKCPPFVSFSDIDAANLVKYYLRVQNYMSAAVDPTNAAEIVEEHIAEIFAKGFPATEELETPTIHAFNNDCLPKIVSLLLARTDLSSSLKARLNQFLQKVMDLIIARITAYPSTESALELLLQLFNGPSRGFFAQSENDQAQMEDVLRKHFYNDNDPAETAPTPPSTGLSLAGLSFFSRPTATNAATSSAATTAPVTVSAPDATQPLSAKPIRSSKFTGRFARLTEDQDASLYFIINIQYFGTHGGFDVLLTKLRDLLPPSDTLTQPSDSISAGDSSSSVISSTAANNGTSETYISDLRTLKLFVAPFTKIQAFFTDRFLHAFAVELQELVFTHLLRLPEKEIKKESNKGISDVAKHIENLLINTKVMSKEEAGERTILFNLNLAMKSFMSASVEKRLNGLSVMNKLLSEVISSITNKAKRDERPSMLLGFMRSSREQYPSLDIKFFVTWLKQNNFVRILSDESTRPELIKQGLDLLTLMAEHDQFGREELDMLWGAAVGSHASTKAAVFRCLLEIAPNLPAEVIVHLIENKLESVKDRDYDATTLHFISSLSLITVKMTALNLVSLPPPSSAVNTTTGTPPLLSISTAPISVSAPPTPTLSAPPGSLDYVGTGTPPQEDTVKTSSRPPSPLPNLGSRPPSPLPNLTIPPSVLSISAPLPLALFPVGPTSSAALVAQLRRGRFALNIFWKLMQTPSKAPLEVKQMASDLLLQLLTNPDFQGDRIPVCARCIENLGRYTSVPQSLDLLMRVVSTYPEKKAWKKDSKRSIIETLETQYQLIARLFAHLEERTKRLKSKRDDISPGGASALALAEESFTTQADIFMFIEFIMQNSSLELNRQQAELLWESVVTNARSESERDDALIWFRTEVERWAAQPDSAAHTAVFEEDALTLLFTQKLSQLDINIISPTAFSLFETLFSYINERDRKLIVQRQVEHEGELDDSSTVRLTHSPSGPHTQSVAEVVSYADLAGLSQLWEVALKTQNTDVAALSCRLLSALVHRLSPGMKKKHRQRTREQFVLGCIDRIANAIAEDPSLNPQTTPARVVERCLVLLRVFVDNLQSPSFPVAASQKKPSKDKEHKRNKSGSSSIVSSIGKFGILGTGTREPKEKNLTLNVVVLRRNHTNLALVLTMPPSETVATLKSTILSRVEANKVELNNLGRPRSRSADALELDATTSSLFDPVEVRIISMGVEITGESQSLASLGWIEGQKVYANVTTDDDDSDLFDADLFEDSSTTPSGTHSRHSSKSSTNTTNNNVSAGKKRNIDAGWLEAMQQQLQAIGLSKTSSIFASNAGTGSPGTAAATNTKEEGVVREGANMDAFTIAREEDRVKSSMVLASQEHFDRLYHLLTVSDAVALKAWQLLRLLPLSPAMLQRFRDIRRGVVPWETLLDFTHRYRFLYALHILQTLSRENPSLSDTDTNVPSTEPIIEALSVLSDTASSTTSVMSSTPSSTTTSSAIKEAMDSVLVTPSSPAITSTSNGKQTASLPRPASWRKRFAETGGVLQLLRVFVDLSKQLDGSQSITHDGALVSCLASLLEVLGLTILDYTQDNVPVVTPGAIAAALHSVIPLIFNVLKLPPSLSMADNALRVPTIVRGTFPDSSDENEQAEPRVRLSTFLEMLMLIIRRVAHAAGCSNEDDLNLVKHGLRVFLGCCGSFLPGMKWERNGHEAWLLDLVLNAHESGVRDEAVLVLESLAKHLFERNAKQATTDVESNASNSLDPSPISRIAQLLRSLFALLPKAEVLGDNASQYFKLTTRLVTMYGVHVKQLITSSSTHIEGAEIITGLLPVLCQQLLNHPIRETSSSIVNGYEDANLIGLLQLMTAWFSCLGSASKSDAGRGGFGLLDQIFRNCLFDIAKAENHGLYCPPKCKSDASRRAAMQLLMELVRGCSSNLAEVLTLCDEQQDQVELPQGWNINLKRDERSPYGFVGLLNLGNTCYLNSLLQQFFNITRLRDGILALEYHRPLADENDLPPEQTLFYQLQILFGNLLLSQSKFYDAQNFCHAFKDINGQRINVYQQMDVQEFCNILVDKVEYSLKGTPGEHLLDEVFGGRVINQIICRDCPHRSEREEPFIMIGVDIKNNARIEDGLKMFVKGELLDGNNKYHCAVCNMHVAATKRVCLKQLPTTLVVHLKRFEFDFDQMKNVKLNDRCEFPIELDMWPYTKDALDQEDRLGELDDDEAMLSPPPPPSTASSSTASSSNCRYELVGVLVHQGTADSGHYYSFVKERTGGNWFEFNDTRVKPFDSTTIDDECFGGVIEYIASNQPQSPALPSSQGQSNPASSISTSSGRRGDGDTSSPNMGALQRQPNTVLRPKTYNAYMLFYERINTNTTEKVAGNINQPSHIPLPMPLTTKPKRTRTPSTDALTSMIDAGHASSFDRIANVNDDASLTELPARPVMIPQTIKIRPDILRSIWDHNTTVLQTRQLFSADYATLLWSLIHVDYKSVVDDNSLSTSMFASSLMVKYVTRFVVEVVAHISNESESHLRLNDWLRFLRQSYRGQVDECLWFLSEASAFAKEVLITCPIPITRRKFTKLFRDVLRVVAAERAQLARHHGFDQDNSESTDHNDNDKAVNGKEEDIESEVALRSNPLPINNRRSANYTDAMPASDGTVPPVPQNTPADTLLLDPASSSPEHVAIDETLQDSADELDDETRDGASTPGTINVDELLDELPETGTTPPGLNLMKAAIPQTSDYQAAFALNLRINTVLDEFYDYYGSLMSELTAVMNNQNMYITISNPGVGIGSTSLNTPTTTSDRPFVEYFLVLREIALLGPSERKRLISKKFVARLIEFYMNEERQGPRRLSIAVVKEPSRPASLPPLAPVTNNMTGQTAMAVSSPKLPPKDVSFQPAIETLTLLGRSCTTIGQADPQGPSPLSLADGTLTLPADETRLLFDKAFLLSIIRDGTYLNDFMPLLEYWTWGNKQTSKTLVTIVTDGLRGVPPDVMDLLLRVLSMVVETKDSLKTWREEHPISALLGTMADNATEKALLDKCMRWLCQRTEGSEGVLLWFSLNKARLQELLRDAGWEKRKIEMATTQPAEFVKQHSK